MIILLNLFDLILIFKRPVNNDETLLRFDNLRLVSDVTKIEISSTIYLNFKSDVYLVFRVQFSLVVNRNQAVRKIYV